MAVTFFHISECFISYVRVGLPRTGACWAGACHMLRGAGARPGGIVKKLSGQVLGYGSRFYVSQKRVEVKRCWKKCSLLLCPAK